MVEELLPVQLKQENIRLKRELNAAVITIDKLLQQANTYREEITSLQSLVSATVPVLAAPAPSLTVKEEKTPAQLIADSQLERLKAAALTRQLTLEEVRIYDFLVKNQRLSNEKPEEPKSNYREVSDIELIKIAETTHKLDNREE